METRTVLVGLSGACGAGVDGLVEEGSLPFLKGLLSSGTRSATEFPMPSSSVAAWTTMITGRSPAAHGIFDLFRKQSPQGHQLRTMTSRDLVCEAVWTCLDREGRRTTVCDYPLTFPPPRIGGHVVPGSWTAVRQLRLGWHPSDLSRRLSEQGIAQLEAFAMEWLPEADAAEEARRAGWIKTQIERERQIFKTLQYLTDSEPSDLTILLLRAFGTVQTWHTQFPDGRAACRRYFAALDNNLGELVRAAGPRVNVVLVSEPESARTSRTLFINAWLAQHGYLAWAGGQGPSELASKVLDTDQLTRQAKWMDWTATHVFAPAAGANEVHIVRQDSQHPRGIVEADYKPFRSRLMDELSVLREIRRVWRGEEMYSGPHQQLAPDLVLEPQPGVAISPLASASVTSSSAAGETFAANRPQGLFMAGGPAFRRGAVIPALSILDVAPLLLYTLGVAIPSDLEGRVPVEALDPAMLEAQPVRTGEGAAERAPDKPVLDPKAEDIVLQRLRSLGYLD